MRALSGLILSLMLAQFTVAQTRQNVATPFSQAPAPPGAAYDRRTDPRLFDPSWVPRVFQLKYVDAFWIEQLLYPYGALVERQPNLNSVAVRAPSAVIENIAQLIKQMDVPANGAKSVELTCYLILASPAGTAENVPAALKPVLDQLRNVLAYRSYSVIDTIIGRSTATHDISLEGGTAKVSDSAPWIANYKLIARPSVTGEGADQVVRLDPVRFTAQLETVNPEVDPRYPASRTVTTPVNVATSLDIKKGQQIVVGKSSVRDHALILVISAKVE
jgi:hypothetical protein